MNQYPLWKYLLISTVILVCTIYALPNLFGEDPAVQISPGYARDVTMTEAVQTTVENKLKDQKKGMGNLKPDPEKIIEKDVQ